MADGIQMLTKSIFVGTIFYKSHAHFLLFLWLFAASSLGGLLLRLKFKRMYYKCWVWTHQVVVIRGRNGPCDLALLGPSPLFMVS